MYIDKIYTKLYSDKNWNGLEQLVSEIRQFAISELNRRALNAKLKKAGKMYKSNGEWDEDHYYRGSLTPSNGVIHELARAKKMGDLDSARKYRKLLENMYDTDIPLDKAKENVKGLLGISRLATGNEIDKAQSKLEDFRDQYDYATLDKF